MKPVHHLRDDEPPRAEPLSTAGALFACLGQVLLCLDDDLRVVHASEALDRWGGEGACRRVLGRTAESLLGPGLFGPEGSLRHALRIGEAREGFRADLRLDEPHRGRLVAVAGAPLPADLADLPGRYLLSLRSVERATVPAATVSLFCGMVARSASMLQVFRQVRDLGDSTATVLIAGESGTGKELIARAVHQHSPRRNGPFVAVNCGGLPEGLLDSELFGHARGAFTGAVQDRVGRFEAARGGTLFLDEVGDLPIHLQVKLLRVLEQGAFERIGENRTRATDARIVAATHVDLKQARRQGSFREDLYYRLRVVTLRLPPLRERLEDVEPLAHYLLARIAARDGRDLKLGSDTLSHFLRYPWPGNVRELKNALEHAAALTQGGWLHVDALPEELLETNGGTEAEPAAQPAPAPGDEDPLDPERLRRALEAHQWRRAETARALGISRSTLWRRLRELGWS